MLSISDLERSGLFLIRSISCVLSGAFTATLDAFCNTFHLVQIEYDCKISSTWDCSTAFPVFCAVSIRDRILVITSGLFLRLLAASFPILIPLIHLLIIHAGATISPASHTPSDISPPITVSPIFVFDISRICFVHSWTLLLSISSPHSEPAKLVSIHAISAQKSAIWAVASHAISMVSIVPLTIPVAHFTASSPPYFNNSFPQSLKALPASFAKVIPSNRRFFTALAASHHVDIV